MLGAHERKQKEPATRSCTHLPYRFIYSGCASDKGSPVFVRFPAGATTTNSQSWTAADAKSLPWRSTSWYWWRALIRRFPDRCFVGRAPAAVRFRRTRSAKVSPAPLDRRGREGAALALREGLDSGRASDDESLGLRLRGTLAERLLVGGGGGCRMRTTRVGRPCSFR